MRRLYLLFASLLILILPLFLAYAQDQDQQKAGITSLVAGDAVRGLVSIVGNTAVEGFVSWELTFGYTGDITGSWFYIAEGDEPITNDTLTDWDTTMITDGTYNIRLTIYLEGDRRTHSIVSDIRVRNYTPIETQTSMLTTTPYTETPQPIISATIMASPTFTIIPDTPTPLPTNPIEISGQRFSTSLMRGALGTLAAFLIAGLYTTIRNTFRRPH